MINALACILPDVWIGQGGFGVHARRVKRRHEQQLIESEGACGHKALAADRRDAGGNSRGHLPLGATTREPVEERLGRVAARRHRGVLQLQRCSSTCESQSQHCEWCSWTLDLLKALPRAVLSASMNEFDFHEFGDAQGSTGLCLLSAPLGVCCLFIHELGLGLLVINYF